MNLKSISLYLLSLIIISCSSTAAESTNNEEQATDAAPEQSAKLISPDEFEKKMKEEGVVVLDVRTPEEVAEGVIEGATVIDFRGSEFKTLLDELDKDKTYMVYCRSGRRSNATQTLMLEMGFGQVLDLEGGITAWQKAGKPVVKPE